MSDFKLPKTVKEAVTDILNNADSDLLIHLGKIKDEEDLFYHMIDPLGSVIMDKYEIWDDNPELLKSTGKLHPHDGIVVIIEAVWKKHRRTRQ